MKKLLVISIIILSLFLIYLNTMDRKVYYVALGDDLALGKTTNGNIDYSYTDYIKDYLKDKKVLEKYIREFSIEDNRITDLINNIEDNKKIVINNKKQTIKNALIKADLLTISIGSNEIYYKINDLGNCKIYDYIDSVLKDYNNLFKLVKEYCKEDVIIIGIYNIYKDDYVKEKIFSYLNKSLKELCKQYGFIYINTDAILNKNDFNNKLNYFPTKHGYFKIADTVIKSIDKSMLK